MQWTNDIKSRRRIALYSLRDIRTAKGISQRQLAEVLKMSRSMYQSIEAGHRRPNIDTLYMLAVIYGCSMDFIYHAFYRQHYIWYYPDAELQYSMRQAKQYDIQYLQERSKPQEPPSLPGSVVWETEAEEDFKPYGLKV